MNIQRPVPLSPSLHLVLDARGDTEARALHTIGKSVAQGGTLGDIGRRGHGRVEGGGWEGIEAGEWEGRISQAVGQEGQLEDDDTRLLTLDVARGGKRWDSREVAAEDRKASN